MTTILAVATPQGSYMGADSQITDGDKRILSPSTPKIVKVGKYLLGISGDCRPGDVLMYNWKPPAYDGTDPVKFMGRKVVPSIIAAFKAQGYDYTKEGTSYSYLIAFAGNVFEIGDDLSMSQSSDGIYGVGSGSPYGLGFLACSENPKDEILKALQVSAKYDINTSEPFQLEYQPS
jgi:ATP-dependent protease HslVU (ClpYQ) peptidase subunit